MAEQFYTILTAIGKAKIANTTALGTKVNLTKFQVGDGNGTYYNPTEDQTELKHKTWEGPISSITVDENNPNWIVIQVMLPGDIGGFTIREAGVFDDENNLIATGKYPETYKPIASDGSTKDLVIKMILEVSNASSVTLKVDPTVILATKKDIEILENKISNVRIPVTSVNEKIGNVVLKAKDIQCDDTHTIEQNIVELQDQFEALELTAEKVTITDTENNFTSGQVEGALKECITKATTALNKANEAFQSADRGKSQIANVVGQPLSASDQFDVMNAKIQSLKNTFVQFLKEKKQVANFTDSLQNLISKVQTINCDLKYATGSTSGWPTITVSNLDFTPKIVFYMMFEVSQYMNEEELGFTIKLPTVCKDFYFYNNKRSTVDLRYDFTTSYITLNQNGFTIEAKHFGAKDWIAIGM